MTNRILLISSPRSGSTYLTIILKQHINRIADLDSFPAEFFNGENWQSAPKGIDTYIDALNIAGNLNSDENLRTLFLRLLQNQNYVYKFFPSYVNKVNAADLLSAITQNNIRVLFLYRSSIVDTAISQMVVANTNITNNSVPLTMQDFEYNEAAIVSALESYQDLHDLYNTLSAAGIQMEKVRYEDLTFDPLLDIQLFYPGETNVDNGYVKLVTPEIRQSIIDTFNIEDQINTLISNYSFPHTNLTVNY